MYTPTHISMSPCAPGDVHMHTTQLYLLGEKLLKNNNLIISGQVIFPHNTMKYTYTSCYNLQSFFFCTFLLLFYVYTNMNKPCIHFCTYACALHQVTLPSTKSNWMCSSKRNIAGQEKMLDMCYCIYIRPEYMFQEC